MYDFEYPIAQIDDVAILLDRIGGGCEGRRRQPGEYLIGHVGLGQGVEPVRIGENNGFGAMNDTVVKLMMVADMVEVGAAGHGIQDPFLQVQRDHAAVR